MLGSSRRRIAAKAALPNGKSAYFVGPDNGVFSLVCGYFTDIVELLPERVQMDGERLSTFDGRDVFSPAGARLLEGESLESLGVELFKDSLVRASLPIAAATEEGVLGEVVEIDAYGNLISNIELDSWPSAGGAVYLEEREDQLQLVSSYDEIREGTLAALKNSSGVLEIASKQASAEKLSGLGLGAKIKLVRK